MKPFWERKPLEEMTRKEWESLCDGCGRCCLNKLEDEDTLEIFFTNVACSLLDGERCRCRSYKRRLEKVPDCLALSPDNVFENSALPKSCAYRRLAEGKKLEYWHPLLSGDPDSVHNAGISVRGRTFSEEFIPADQFEAHIVNWFDDG